MIDDPEKDDGAPPPRRLSNGELVPVGLDPIRLARMKKRRAQWGALRAVPLHGVTPKATRNAKDRQ